MIITVFFCSGNSGIHLSAYEGHDEVIEIFLYHGVDVNVRGINSLTPLMGASLTGHYSSTKLLLDHGANIDLQNAQGNSALMLGTNYPDIIGLLLSRGANLDLVNEKGDTVSKRAVNSDCFDAVKIFEAWKNPKSKDKSAYDAAFDGSTRLLRGFLTSGATMNHRDRMNDTGLHVAAFKGHVDAIQVILDHGGDVNINIKVAKVGDRFPTIPVG